MSIYKKLFEAKKEIGKISKDSTNPFYKSKYFDINQLLEHVEPILQKNQLIVLQPILSNSVVTQIIDIETDQMVSSGLELTNQTDPQKRGSEITYYRRYTLGSLLGLQAEDDDANATVKSKEQTQNSPNDNKPWLNVGSKEWNGALEKGSSIEQLKQYFKISKANQEQYILALNK
jgi:hypothetical protein